MNSSHEYFLEHLADFSRDLVVCCPTAKASVYYVEHDSVPGGYLDFDDPDESAPLHMAYRLFERVTGIDVGELENEDRLTAMDVCSDIADQLREIYDWYKTHQF